MHELGYTRDVVDTVVEAARLNGANEVRAVHLNIGEVRDIVDELFRNCFKYLARDTVAENAEVVINRIPLKFYCRDCDDLFSADVYAGRVHCPVCNGENYEVKTGMEFSIDHLEIA